MMISFIDDVFIPGAGYVHAGSRKKEDGTVVRGKEKARGTAPKRI